MTDENFNRVLVVLFFLSILVYPIAIPIWIAATAISVVRSYWNGGY